MNALGPIAKLAAALIGKQPEDELHPRGFLGIELAEEPGRAPKVVRASWPTRRPPRPGLKAGDRLVEGPAARRSPPSRPPATPSPRSGPATRSPLAVVRDGKPIDLTLTAGEGF